MTHIYESLSSLYTFSVAAGIDVALDPTSQPLLEQIQAINHGRKPDMVIVTPSKISVMEQGIELVGPVGTLLLFAPPAPKELLSLSPNRFFFQEITLRTSYSAGPYETRQALELLRCGRLRPETMRYDRFGLHDAAQAFKVFTHPGNALKVVISCDL